MHPSVIYEPIIWQLQVKYQLVQLQVPAITDFPLKHTVFIHIKAGLIYTPGSAAE